MHTSSCVVVLSSCDVVEVFFNVASYMPRPSVDMPRPSVQDLAKVLQVILLSGRVGEHRVNSSVSAILGMYVCMYVCMYICMYVVPCEVCDGCHGDLVLDGLFCRAPVSCDGGGDVDGDGFPDECDVCPYLFNPEQTSDPCAPQQGVCPGDLDEAILWSATSAGVSDVKPCPLPLLGTHTQTHARTRAHTHTHTHTHACMHIHTFRTHISQLHVPVVSHVQASPLVFVLTMLVGMWWI